MATNYFRQTHEGVNLHIIKTAASNIQLINQLNTTRQNMQNSGYYGINGGFFNFEGDHRTLNIAVNNGQCVGPYLNNFLKVNFKIFQGFIKKQLKFNVNSITNVTFFTQFLKVHIGVILK